MDVPQHPGRGVIDAGDCGSVHDEPFNLRSCALDEAPDVSHKAISIGIEKVGAELKDYQARPAKRAWERTSWPPVAVVVDQYSSVGSIAVANMTEQRQRHRQDNALFDADHDDHRCG